MSSSYKPQLDAVDIKNMKQGKVLPMNRRLVSESRLAPFREQRQGNAYFHKKFEKSLGFLDGTRGLKIQVWTCSLRPFQALKRVSDQISKLSAFYGTV